MWAAERSRASGAHIFMRQLRFSICCTTVRGNCVEFETYNPEIRVGEKRSELIEIQFWHGLILAKTTTTAPARHFHVSNNANRTGPLSLASTQVRVGVAVTWKRLAGTEKCQAV